MLKKLIASKMLYPFIAIIAAFVFTVGYKTSGFFSSIEIAELKSEISSLNERAAKQRSKVDEYKAIIAETILIQNNRVSEERRKAEKTNEENAKAIKELENKKGRVVQIVDCSHIDVLINEDLGL